jgi:HlyD family secretion protein
MGRKIEKKKWPPRRVAIYGVSGLFTLFIIYTLLFGDTSSKLNVKGDRITIDTVIEGDFQEYIPVTGSVIPIKTVYLDAFEGGRVEKKFIEAGAMVEKGDEILQLANTNLLMDIMFREAELFEQSNNLRNTRLQMEQYRLQLQANLIEMDYQIQKTGRIYRLQKQLFEQNLGSKDEYEKAREEYDYFVKRKNLAIETFKQDSLFRKIQIGQLEASLERMQQNLALVKTKLENLTLRAPVSGQLTSLNAEIGESKSAGERLGQVDILDGFKVRAGIDEHYLPRINLGLAGEFDFAGETCRMVTAKIFPEINEGRFNVDLVFTGKEPAGIRRGQTVHIRLELGDLTEALLLARGGFYQKTGGQWVYVLDESEDVAVKREIRLGRQNPQYFEVLEGLQPGEKVITSSYENFGDKDKLLLD